MALIRLHGVPNLILTTDLANLVIVVPIWVMHLLMAQHCCLAFEWLLEFNPPTAPHPPPPPAPPPHVCPPPLDSIHDITTIKKTIPQQPGAIN